MAGRQQIFRKLLVTKNHAPNKPFGAGIEWVSLNFAELTVEYSLPAHLSTHATLALHIVHARCLKPWQKQPKTDSYASSAGFM